MQDVIKQLLLTFGSIIVAGVAFWISWGMNLVSRTEARQIALDAVVASPYREDREMLMEINKRNTQSIEETSRSISEIKVQVGRLEEKADQVIHRLERDGH